MSFWGRQTKSSTKKGMHHNLKVQCPKCFQKNHARNKKQIKYKNEERTSYLIKYYLSYIFAVKILDTLTSHTCLLKKYQSSQYNKNELCPLKEYYLRMKDFKFTMKYITIWLIIVLHLIICLTTIKTNRVKICDM